MTERIEVPVPEGFPPMCEPVQEQSRLEAVVVVPASEKYLSAMAESFDKSYPQALLDSVTADASNKRDVGHLRKRLSPTLQAPNVTMLVATLGRDGPFMGSACYMSYRVGSRDEPQHHPMHILRPAAFRPGRGSHNFQGLMGWTNAEVDEMHSDLDINLLESIMADHQSQRERLMGSDRPYIMLGPIWVSSEYRSRGVGGKLIEKGFAMAQDAGVPLLLSGVFPNALPAYLHLGFEPLEGYGDLMVWWPQGVPKARLEGGKLVD